MPHNAGFSSPEEGLVGYAIHLLGDQIDLALWAENFPVGFDPFVVRLDHRDREYVLKAVAFDSESNPTGVRERAATLVAQINGAMAADAAAEPITVGPVLYLHPDGRIDRRMFVEPASFRIRSFSTSPTITSRDQHGNLVPQPAPPRPRAQIWTQLAQEDDELSDLLAHHGRSAGDWYEIYKTFEVAIELGKRLGGYKNLLSGRYARAEEVKRAANVKRHWKVKGELPKDVTMADATEMLRFVVTSVMAAAEVRLPKKNKPGKPR